MRIRKELLSRVREFEDGFTERKPESASDGEIRETLVAFSNTVPPGRTAALFIGVGDDGQILGLSNPDSRQKKITRVCDRECYPPIPYQCEVFFVEDKAVLAVIVPESFQRPHFAGGAFIRHGSVNVQATEEEYDQLILTRVDKCREILRHKNSEWYVRSYRRQLEEPEELERGMSAGANCRIEAVNPFYVRFRRTDSNTLFSVELAAISLLWHDKTNRPMAVVRPIRYAGGL